MGLLLRNACLFGREGRFNVVIEGDRITAVEPALDSEPPHGSHSLGAQPAYGSHGLDGGGVYGSAALRVLDLAGQTVLPAFVDAHTHLDKTLTADRIPNESCTLDEAVERYVEYFRTVSEEDIYERARRAARMAVANGTGAMRTHIVVNAVDGLRFIRPILALREELRGEIDVQVVAFPLYGEEERKIRWVTEEALCLGADVLGGCPSSEVDGRGFIDDMFALAEKYGIPLDFHVDETDDPRVLMLEYLAEKTIGEGWQGRVTAGHCCSLSYVPQETADRVIAKVKEADLNIVTLPSCNMFLIGDRIRLSGRGITRVNELRLAGVNVAYASDNVRDPFRPFGNADMLQEGLFTAQVIKKGYPRDLLEVLHMGTYAPARALQLPDYGLEPGDYADLVVLAAPDPVEAILSQVPKNYVIHRGKIVASKVGQY